MPRRSYGFSATQISRMISASNSAKQARQRMALIDSQSDLETTKSPEYSIDAFDFNPETRVAHIEFLETKKYRKIERYVTQNGVKYPIYGDWNTKTKIIRKTIKLTNENLEKLNEYDDDLISLFCCDIVVKLENEELYPSWFVIDVLKTKQKLETNETDNTYKTRINWISEDIAGVDEKIKSNKEKSDADYESLLKAEKKLNKLTNKIINLEDKKRRTLYSLLTIGIYLLFCTKSRIKKLYEKKALFENNAKEINKAIDESNSNARVLKHEKETLINKVNELKKERSEKLKSIKNTYEEKINSVVPLPIGIDTECNNEFIPLKVLCGMNYEKIIGCYVIHNIENNKYYVGQSKDVMKRICKQHFNGTKVKNVVFAEDYYTSKLENKEDLFEVKIIKLQTKDELDATEMQLIEQYDSFNNGCNGTNGNN